MKKNRACVAEIDEILADHKEAIDKIRTSIVSREELIEHFNLKSEDPKELEDALKLMFDRVGMLQNAIVHANKDGNSEEAFELSIELIEIRELRNEVLLRLRDKA